MRPDGQPPRRPTTNERLGVRRRKAMKYSLLALAAVLLLLLGASGCSEMTAPEGPTATDAPSAISPLRLSLDTPCGDPCVVPLVIGPRQPGIGTVTVSNDETELYITLATNPGWKMTGTQVSVLASLDRMRFNRFGNPRLRSFTFRENHKPPVIEYTYSLNLAGARFASGDTLFISAHAQVAHYNAAGRPTRRADAWGAGDPLPGPSRAMYFAYQVQTCDIALPCGLTVVWPNGGESICEGDTVTVAWNVEGDCVESVRIELYRDGTLCQLLAASAPNSGAFLWEGATRTDFETDGYVLRIQAADGESVDGSDAPFAIDQCGGPE
jgi:hypothetical protein